MRILNFEKFNLLEFHKMDNILPQNHEYDFKIVDVDGTHFVKVKLSSYGWSLHREIIYYEFTVIESESESYITGGVLILGLDFNKKKNQFHFYPYYNDEGAHKMDQMSEITKNAYIEIY
jgi:hypothetical protein